MKIVAPLTLYILTFLFCIAVATVPSCSGVDCKDPKNGSNAKCAVENAVIDCTTKTAQDFVAQHVGDVSKFFGPNGIDWTAIEQALVNLVIPEASCVLETAWNNYFATITAPPTPVGSGSDSGSAAPMKLHDPAADKAKKDALSAKLWPGKTAKLH
jgi:hypothetical protein